MNQAINYTSILQETQADMELKAAWLNNHCGSQLEVIVGLAILGIYDGGDPDMVSYCDDHLHLFEPFTVSPSSNGCSSAFLTTQYKDDSGIWDFCIHTGGDNGDYFGAPGVNPALLIDIDGYGSSRPRAALDNRKLDNCSMRAIIVREERFRDLYQIAEAILYSSIWDCCCQADEPVREYCNYCDSSRLGLLVNKASAERIFC